MWLGCVTVLNKSCDNLWERKNAYCSWEGTVGLDFFFPRKNTSLFGPSCAIITKATTAKWEDHYCRAEYMATASKQMWWRPFELKVSIVACTTVFTPVTCFRFRIQVSYSCKKQHFESKFHVNIGFLLFRALSYRVFNSCGPYNLCS